MKKQARLYNVLFPIWILLLFPQVWLISLAGNLAIDCLVLFLTLLALKHAQKGAVMKGLWWKFWLLGFAADLVGTVWMIIGWALTAIPAVGDLVLYINILRPWTHPVTFLWTLAGIALAGVCIYFFDRRTMKGCELLDPRQKHILALTMALATPPWLFFVPGG